MGNNKVKTVAVSGAGGFIGSHLTRHFQAKGFEVIALPREYFTDIGVAQLKNAVGRSDVVINLAGAPINHRWSPAYKKELYDSRISTTRCIVDAIRTSATKPEVFFSTSAVGYYSPDDCNTEQDFKKGTGFLSDLCKAWESEAREAEAFTRTVIMRFGLVLSPDGGVFKSIQLPTRFRFATLLGNGRQFFPWIDLNDLTGAVEFIMEDRILSGLFNFVAPEVVTGGEFTQALARFRHTWLTVKIPGAAFKAALGEASSFVLSGQCVVPEKLLRAGYVFRSPDVETFFRNYRG